MATSEASMAGVRTSSLTTGIMRSTVRLKRTLGFRDRMASLSYHVSVRGARLRVDSHVAAPTPSSPPRETHHFNGWIGPAVSGACSTLPSVRTPKREGKPTTVSDGIPATVFTRPNSSSASTTVRSFATASIATPSSRCSYRTVLWWLLAATDTASAGLSITSGAGRMFRRTDNGAPELLETSKCALAGVAAAACPGGGTYTACDASVWPDPAFCIEDPPPGSARGCMEAVSCSVVYVSSTGLPCMSSPGCRTLSNGEMAMSGVCAVGSIWPSLVGPALLELPAGRDAGFRRRMACSGAGGAARATRVGVSG